LRQRSLDGGFFQFIPHSASSIPPVSGEGRKGPPLFFQLKEAPVYAIILVSIQVKSKASRAKPPSPQRTAEKLNSKVISFFASA
jgi:hypothetical protein